MKQRKQMEYAGGGRRPLCSSSLLSPKAVMTAVLLAALLAGCGQNGKAESAEAGSFADALSEGRTATQAPNSPAGADETLPPTEARPDLQGTSPSDSEVNDGDETDAAGGKPTAPGESSATAGGTDSGTAAETPGNAKLPSARPAEEATGNDKPTPSGTTGGPTHSSRPASGAAGEPGNSPSPASPPASAPPDVPSPSPSSTKNPGVSQGKGTPVIGWSDFFDNDKQDRPSEHFWDMSEQKQTVEIKGFMGEVLSFDKHWFLLIPKPGAECPFDNGDETYWNKIMMVFVPESTKLRYTSGPLKITGRLDVGIKIDESGYKTMFRLYDAKFEKISE